MKISAQFLRFLAVGSSAAFVNWLAGRLFALVMPLSVAIVIAYVIAVLFAYVLNRRFVFEPSQRSRASELSRFVLVNLVALVQVWAVTMALARIVFPSVGFAWNADASAHAIGIASPVFTSYFGHRYFSFAPAKPSGDADGQNTNG